MKLITYNQSNCVLMKSGKPTIRINMKSGAISINHAAMAILGMTANSRIELLQDETRPKDWYIKKSEDENAFVLRRKTGSESGAIFQSTALARRVFASLDTKSHSASFLLASEPTQHEGVDLYAILTKSFKEGK